MSGKPAITPQTKVAELLDAYPELESRLMDYVPAFEKLKNPVLRKTIARVATLETAASMAGIPVEKLVAALRKILGLTETEHETAAAAERTKMQPDNNPGRPAWLEQSRIAQAVNADEYLNRGEHPLNTVFQLVKDLKPGEAVRLTSTFRPIPLIEKMEQAGHAVWCVENEPGRFDTFIGGK
jgi:hypothetical protein